MTEREGGGERVEAQTGTRDIYSEKEMYTEIQKQKQRDKKCTKEKRDVIHMPKTIVCIRKNIKL